ncbi:hypothetical protein [Streptomyces sp. NPDC002265]|uniref:hypothetical protein n=1 Tax=Streptomyces sp. NPDC002265 TaxID=3154415 RepID=UPI00332904E7
MSQTTPPPGPPADNPYAGQSGRPTQPDATGESAQTGDPQGTPQPGFPVTPGIPVAPVAPVRDNFVLGLAAAVGAGLVSAILYGIVVGLTEHEIGYAAVGVGFLVGIAAGRAGGRSQSLPVAGVIVSVAAVYLGQLIGTAMLGAKELGVGFNEVFFGHFGVVQDAWQETADPLTFVFFAIAAYVAFQSTRRNGVR